MDKRKWRSFALILIFVFAWAVCFGCAVYRLRSLSGLRHDPGLAPGAAAGFCRGVPLASAVLDTAASGTVVPLLQPAAEKGGGGRRCDLGCFIRGDVYCAHGLAFSPHPTDDGE